MSEVPALRLWTEQFRAHDGQLVDGAQQRLLMLDGPGVLRLRKELGNDAYDVLETLFILAAPSPTGWVVTEGAPRLVEALGWGRHRVSRTMTELEAAGYLVRAQEASTDDKGRVRFGRQVITLNVQATAGPAMEQPTTSSTWGVVLSEDVCCAVLSYWNVKDARSLVERKPQALVSDAVKYVAFAMQSGAAILNPGAYVRRMIEQGRVAAPLPHVPALFLTEQLTVDQLVVPSRANASRTVQEAERAARSRRSMLENLLNSLPAAERETIDLKIEELGRAFFRDPEPIREIKLYDLLESELLARGLLGGSDEWSGD